VSFDPPGPPYLPSETGSANSIAHFADPDSHAGIHVLAFPAHGGLSGTELHERVAAYVRGLEGSVAGLALLGVRPLSRYGLHGVEIEYEGGAEPRLRTVDWVLYAPATVYVIKLTAAVRSGSAPTMDGRLVRARDSLLIELRTGAPD
jgi:hypothetical protein